MIGGPPAYVAVLRFDLAIHGARSLKDRRRVVVSLRDRLRARFDVACHELPTDAHTRASLVVTTAGGDASMLKAVADRIRGYVDSDAGAVVVHAEDEVFGWPTPPPWRDEEDDDV